MFVLTLILGLMMAAPVPGPQQLEEQARRIEGKLIAPCCWSQPVSQHYSQAADEIRRDVRLMLAEGKTEREILDHYVSVYGERILAEPPVRGFNLLAYALPWISLAFGGLIVFTFLRKWKARSRAPVTGEASRIVQDPAIAARLERELHDFE